MVGNCAVGGNVGGVGEDIIQNPIHLMVTLTSDDDFLPGTPPPQNVWEGGMVGKCAVGGNFGGGGEVGGIIGDVSSGEEVLVGRKRGFCNRNILRGGEGVEG